MDLNVYTETDAVNAAEVVKQDPAAPSEIADPNRETASGDTLTRDDLYAKVLKYVPAPLIGIYLMATNLVVSQADNGEEPNEILLWIILAVFLAATGAYLVVRKVRRVPQIGISVVAFLAFAAASPGPFQQISGWDELWGTLALLGAALVLAVFQPGPIPEE
jgi:hypothetical protein